MQRDAPSSGHLYDRYDDMNGGSIVVLTRSQLRFPTPLDAGRSFCGPIVSQIQPLVKSITPPHRGRHIVCVRENTRASRRKALMRLCRCYPTLHHPSIMPCLAYPTPLSHQHLLGCLTPPNLQVGGTLNGGPGCRIHRPPIVCSPQRVSFNGSLIMQKRIPSWSCIALSKYLSGWTHVRYTLRPGNARPPQQRQVTGYHAMRLDLWVDLGATSSGEQQQQAERSRAPRPEEQAARPISSKVRKRCKIFS